MDVGLDSGMVTIRLLGEAGRRFTRTLEVEVQTVSEAMNALLNLLPGFQEYLLEADQRGIGWRVIVDDPRGLSEQEVLEDRPIPRQLILAPIIRGRGEVFQIIAGVVLVAVGLVIGLGAPLGLALFTIGFSFVLGGIARLLSPTAARREAQRTTSFLFTGGNLNSAQGLSVPLLYGETMIRNPTVLSFGISLDRVNYGTAIVCVAATLMPYPKSHWVPQVNNAPGTTFWIGSTEADVVNETTLTMLFPVEGVYTISSVADDEQYVYLDEQLVNSAPFIRGNIPLVTNSVYVDAGYHSLRVQAINRVDSGSCGMKLTINYSGGGITGFDMGAFAIQPAL